MNVVVVCCLILMNLHECCCCDKVLCSRFDAPPPPGEGRCGEVHSTVYFISREEKLDEGMVNSTLSLPLGENYGADAILKGLRFVLQRT